MIDSIKDPCVQRKRSGLRFVATSMVLIRRSTVTCFGSSAAIEAAFCSRSPFIDDCEPIGARAWYFGAFSRASPAEGGAVKVEAAGAAVFVVSMVGNLSFR